MMPDDNQPSPLPPPLHPGYLTSEAWLTLLTIVLGAIPSSGLTADAPLLTKIIGMAIAALAAIHYTAQRTSLKKAHLAAAGALQSSSKTVPQVAASAALVTLVAAIGLAHGCAKTGPGATSPLAAGGNALLQCGKQDLYQLVGDKTLIGTVAGDLLEDNYGQLTSDLIGKIGGDAVGCAMLAVDAVESAAKATVGPRVVSTREARAKELIAKYTWKIAPAIPAAK